MENKTLLLAGMFILIASAGIVYVVQEGDTAYACDDKNKTVVGICFKLSKVNSYGTQTRCYYNESAPTRYKNCKSGWYEYKEEIIQGTEIKLEYHKEEMLVEFVDEFNQSLGSLELKSHEEVGEVAKFGYGEKEVVIYYDNIGLYGEELSAEIIDMSTGEVVEKDFTWVEWSKIEIPTYEEVNCRVSDFNKDYFGCDAKQNGTKEIDGWVELENSKIPNRDTRIGVKTMVNKGDRFDIKIIIGEEKLKINKHAEWTADLNTDLDAYWKLDEASSPIVDSIGNINLTAAGSPVYGETGIIGDAISADSNDDIFSAGDTTAVDYGTTTDFTYNLWFLESAVEGDASVFDGCDYNEASCGVTMVQSNPTSLIFTGNYNGGMFNFNHMGAIDTWHMLTYIRNNSGTDFYLFIDGVYNQTTTDTTETADSNDFHLISDTRLTEYIKGDLDEFGIWGRALSGAEVTQLWNGGSGITWTGYFPVYFNITGFPIRYSNGTNVNGATILAQNEDFTKANYTTTSDVNGDWVIEDVVNATYTIVGYTSNVSIDGDVEAHVVV